MLRIFSRALAATCLLALTLAPTSTWAQTAPASPPQATAAPPTGVPVPPTPVETPPALRAISADTPIARRTLRNGLNVAVVEDHAAAVVQTAVWYRFGSLYETPGKTGLAHALEHMMFRGTPAISGGGLDDITARLGAQMNANTSNDFTHYFFVMPADKLDLSLHIEADRMHNLSLRASDWKLEKGAVLAEIEGDESNPTSKLYYRVRRAAWPNSPYGLTALGVKADVQNATVADLKKYYDTWYAPNNATLVVVGDVKAADVFKRAEALFGAIARKQLPAVRPGSAPPAATSVRVAVKGDFPYTVVDLAYQIPGDVEPGTAPAQLLSAVIGNERSAFYHALVESNVTIGYQAFADTVLRGGLMHVQLYVAPGHTSDEAIKAFQTTLATQVANGFPSDLVADAKLSGITQSVYARDSIAGLGDHVGYPEGIELRPPSVDDALVAAVTIDQVNAAAGRFMKAPNVIGILTPEHPKPGAKGAGGTPSSGVADNFSARAPSGPIVLAPWARAALAKPPSLESKIHPVSFTLGNGMRVLVQRVSTNPTVFIAGRIAQNPRFEPKGKEGVGGLASELMSFGSEKYDFAQQRKVADDIAANVTFGSAFGAHGLSRDLSTMLDLLADGVQHPVYPSQYLELLRTQELASISKRGQNPDYLASRAFDTLLYPPGDPALRETTAASVKAIGVDDLRGYAAKYFRPDLTTMTVVGDVDPADVKTKLEATFGSWANNGPKPSVAQAPIPYPKPAATLVPAIRDQVSVHLGQPTLNRSNPDFYALNMMNSILGGGGSFDTRLMAEIRVRRGLVYGVSSALNVHKYRGTMDFYLSANPNKVREAVAVLRDQMRRLQNERVTNGELERARSKVVNGALVSQQATDAIAAQLSNVGINQLPLDYYSTIARRYGSITAAKVKNVANRYLRPDGLVAVYEGPSF